LRERKHYYKSDQLLLELGVFAREPHGSAFGLTRGRLKYITTVTLGTKNDEQIIDGLREEYTKRFMLHYNVSTIPALVEVEECQKRSRTEEKSDTATCDKSLLKMVFPR